MPMTKPEIELKFCVPDLQRFQQIAIKAGFFVETPRALERNALFDTPDRQLLSNRQLLRMRDYGGRWIDTQKRPPANNHDDAPYKERLETETHVEDGGAMEAVFLELGYAPIFRYEKFRTEFLDRAGDGHLVLDETPIGNFAELEGTPDWIDGSLQRLCVGSESCFTDSYGRMFLDWKARTNSPVNHMTVDEIPVHKAELVAN